jgi:hypothetical protein
MDINSFDSYIERYNDPVFRCSPVAQSEEDKLSGDVPDECVVFRIKHPSKVMVVSRYGTEWVANKGERFVIDALMKLWRPT